MLSIKEKTYEINLENNHPLRKIHSRIRFLSVCTKTKLHFDQGTKPKG